MTWIDRLRQSRSRVRGWLELRTGAQSSIAAAADDATLSHPDTLRTLTELAATLRAQGETSQALVLEQQIEALEDRRARRLSAKFEERRR